jgi:hypothetical protein
LRINVELLCSATVFIFAEAKDTPPVQLLATGREPLWAEIRQVSKKVDSYSSQIEKRRGQNGNFLAGTTFALSDKPRTTVADDRRLAGIHNGPLAF